MAAVGANGAPLDVIGHTRLAVSLGTFQSQYQFTVVQHLTVNCLLGANFLQDLGALLDCHSHTLTLGVETHHSIPIALGKDSVSTHSDVQAPSSFAIRSLHDLNIPGQTVQLITGKVEEQLTNIASALVEPLEEISRSVHLGLACCLTALSNDSEVVLQVMNVDPTLITLYKGMQAIGLTEREILIINHSHVDMFGNF